ncbi:hypothetical protein ACFL60_03280 [Candidatus Omnitrophota bacterium]
MWRLLKAEFSYYRRWLAVNYTVFVLMLALFLIMSFTSLFKGVKFELKPFHIPMIMVITSVLSTVLMLFGKTAGKRDYLHMRLPVSSREIGVSRVLFAVIVWVSLVILFWLPIVVFMSDHLDGKTHLNLFYMLGIFLIFNASWPLHIDYQKDIKRKYKFIGFYDKELLSALGNGMITVTWIFLYGIPGGFIFGLFKQQRKTWCDMFLNPTVITLLVGFGLALTLLSVTVFSRRKSFLE